MLKTALVFLILSLSLLHYINCVSYIESRDNKIVNLTSQMGTCAVYFRYQPIDEFINGNLTLPNMKNGDTVHLIFHLLRDWYYSPPTRGILLPDGTAEEVIQKVNNMQPITYRVDFPVAPGVVTLKQIFFNGKELCSTKFPPTKHNLTFDLWHTLKITNNFVPVFKDNIYIPHFEENIHCGHADTDIAVNRVASLTYGGTPIIRGEHPWLVAIYEKKSTGINFVCGGSLLTSKLILSAAHCFSSGAKSVVMLGRYNLTNYREDNYVIREIESVIIHPEYKYDLGFSDADLAILEMNVHVSFTRFIQPICLWTEPADESLIVNQIATVVGWGSDEDGNPISVVPKMVKMKIVSEAVCLRSSTAFNKITTFRTLCAGNRDGSGPCEGDSGGGLMVDRNGHWLLRGVTSAGLKFNQRCDLREFTVYCDIAKHLPWLKKQIKKQKYTPGSVVDKQNYTPPSVTEICGRSGTERRTENPWLTAIYRKTLPGLKFFCTGALISSRTVLAPANCMLWRTLLITSTDSLRLYFGRYDLNNFQEHRVITRDVANAIYHPGFTRTNTKFQNDNIALLILSEPVSFSEYVKPICLWTEPADQSQIVGQSATISSWDIIDVYEENATVPTSIEVKIVPKEQCQSYNLGTSAHVLCVPRIGYKVEGALMLKRNGRWLLRGLSSVFYYHFPQWDEESFWIYTDLTEYIPWIQSNWLL